MSIPRALRSFTALLGFLSFFPVGRTIFLEDDDFGRLPAFFPAVGLVFGICLFILWHLLVLFLPPQPAATLVVTLLVVINRGFHLDGLADTADALLSHRPRERKLEILKDSRQGTFGVLSIVLCILLKVQLVAIVAPVASWCLILWPIWGRAASAIVAVCSEYVGKSAGFVNLMVEKSSFRELFFAASFTLLLSCFGGGAAIITAAVVIAWSFFLNWLWQESLGGITGDLLGASIELTEIMSLFVFYLAFKALSIYT